MKQAPRRPCSSCAGSDDVAHRIDARWLADEELRGSKRAPREDHAILGPVRKDQALLGAGENDIVVAGDRTAAKRGETDRAFLPLEVGAVTAAFCLQLRSAPAGGGPRLPFAADLTPAARPVAIDGSRELVDGGNHREAVFWVVATAARCQTALNAMAPALAAERERAFRALVADLTGLRSPTDVLTRRASLLADLAPPATG